MFWRIIVPLSSGWSSPRRTTSWIAWTLKMKAPWSPKTSENIRLRTKHYIQGDCIFTLYYINYLFLKCLFPWPWDSIVSYPRVWDRKTRKTNMYPELPRLYKNQILQSLWASPAFLLWIIQTCLTFDVIVRVMCKMETEHITSSTKGISLTLALLMSSSCAAFTFSGFPFHARSTDA